MSSERGRPAERSSGDHYTPREAAQRLGVTEETIRNKIRRGELPGEDFYTHAGERRYHALKSAVEAEAAAKGQLGHIEHAFEVQATEKTLEIIESISEGQAATIQEMETNRRVFLEAGNRFNDKLDRTHER